MKQKAVAMATVFTMMLAVGATGFGNESLHQHPAYTSQNWRVEASPQPVLDQGSKLMLAAPAEAEK